ncbi:MAG: hypothetical protein LUF89_05045 [Ruminococcus sp.]|nr:hypothetical protein [Ruminococcus sp.]
MTIDEAAKKWDIQAKTVLDYIYKGYILDISCDNNEIMLPNIPKPAIQNKRGKLSAQKIYETILRICDNEQYINAKIFGITEEQFEFYMQELEKSGYLSKTNSSADFRSNFGWNIMPTGAEMLLKRKFSLPGITINNPVGIQNAAKIGFVNL